MKLLLPLFGLLILRHELIWRVADDRVDFLIKSLHDNDARIRAEAADELGQLGPNARCAVSALFQSLNDGDAG